MLLAGAVVVRGMAAEPDAVARGAYLAAAAGCEDCHTDAKNGGKPFSGGRVFETPSGKIVSPNITPDGATGIGRWSAADFSRALRWGVAPDDTHYLPIFPFPFYNGLSDADVADLKAFLDSVAPVRQPDVPSSQRPPFLARSGASFSVVAQGLAGPWRPDPSRDAAWNRGSYLVATVGRCGDCHTPRDLWGAPDPDRFLAGTRESGKKVPDITPDPESGIGKWSEDDIETLLKDGQTPDFDFVGGSMGDIVKDTARLTEADRGAIAAYLKTVPAKSFAGK